MYIKNLKKVDKGFVKANFDVVVPKWGNFIIRGCTLYEKEGNCWIGFPSFAIVDKESGEKKYLAYCHFQERENHQAFSLKVIPLLMAELSKCQEQKIDYPLDEDVPF